LGGRQPTTMKRVGSPAAAATYKRTRISHATTSNEPTVSATKDAASSRSKTKTKQFDSVNVDRLRESPLPWEIWSDGLPGAEVFYLPNFLDETAANEMYAELPTMDTWYRPTLRVYGRSITQSRAVAAYATTPDLVVKYSGQTVNMHSPYPPLIAKLQSEVEKVLGLDGSVPPETEPDNDDTINGFNHVLLGLYDDGTVYIGRHRDTKENNVIAGLSLGAERSFIITPSKTNGVKPLRKVLGNGSLLVMQGDTQNNWKHEVPKEPKVKQGRISLTFRQMQ